MSKIIQLIENIKFRLNEITHQYNTGVLSKEEYDKLLRQIEAEIRQLESRVYDSNNA